MNVAIENQIYLLRQLDLSKEQFEKVRKADALYLQDKEKEAQQLLNDVIRDFQLKGIHLFK